MTTYATRPIDSATAGLDMRNRETKLRPTSKGQTIRKLLTTTDHKTIGHMYLVTSFAWFLFAGILALFIRAELTRPGLHYARNDHALDVCYPALRWIR